MNVNTNHNFISCLESPIGTIEIVADEEAVLSVSFSDNMITAPKHTENFISKHCKQQLQEYFFGDRHTFEVPLRFAGTSFQQRVWTQLQKIPFGKTITYLQLAKDLGDPKCIRAAGTANGKNPFAVVVPCHRVIGSNDDLVGYAGGLWRKRWLLEHETDQTKLF
jgi:methylated-DNA-[protein]-cysteine S-methyltransferase